MKYKLLGGTGLMVSEFCLGAMTFGGKKDPLSSVMGALDDQAAGQLVNRDHGSDHWLKYRIVLNSLSLNLLIRFDDRLEASSSECFIV